MNNILIVNKEQYGYHIDTYKYCLYLSGKFNITYLCWDDNKNRIATEGISCVYLKRDGNVLNRFLILLKSINLQINKFKYDLVFIVYFPGCSLLKLRNLNSTFNLDIRTIAVTEHIIKYFFLDRILNLETRFFKYVSVVSKETGDQIKIKDFFVLPLGGESLVKPKISFNDLNIIYVGTLSNRNIMDLIKGFEAYIRNYSPRRKTILTIIGDGYNNELEVLNQYIEEHDLKNFIFTTGYINNDKLGSYFEKATCGVSFIPITPYYQNQPPTKTYEYLLSGLPVLATNTRANSRIVNRTNGILIQDNIEAISKGIFEISENLDSYDSRQIQDDMKNSLWKNIVIKTLKPYLMNIIQEKIVKT